MWPVDAMATLGVRQRAKERAHNGLLCLFAVVFTDVSRRRSAATRSIIDSARASMGKREHTGASLGIPRKPRGAKNNGRDSSTRDETRGRMSGCYWNWQPNGATWVRNRPQIGPSSRV